MNSRKTPPDALRARERVHTLVGQSVSRSVGEFDGRGRGPADDYARDERGEAEAGCEETEEEGGQGAAAWEDMVGSGLGGCLGCDWTTLMVEEEMLLMLVP